METQSLWDHRWQPQDWWAPTEPLWQLGRPGASSLHNTDVLLNKTFTGSIISGWGSPWRGECRPCSHGLLPNVVPESAVPRREGGQQMLQLPHQLLQESNFLIWLGAAPSHGDIVSFTAHQASLSMRFSKDTGVSLYTGVGCHFLFQGTFPTQGSNPGLLHCSQILYQLSYKGNLVYYRWLSINI